MALLSRFLFCNKTYTVRQIATCLRSSEILSSQNPIELLYRSALASNFVNSEGFRLPGKPFAFQLAEIEVGHTNYMYWAMSHHSVNLRTVGFQRVHPDLGIDYLTIKHHTVDRPLRTKDTSLGKVAEIDSSGNVGERQLPPVAICYTVGEGPFNGNFCSQWRGEGLVKALKVSIGDDSNDGSLETILASSNAPNGSIAQIMASAKSAESFGTLAESSGRMRYSLSEVEREKFIKLTHQIKADLENGQYDLQEIAQYVAVHRFRPMRMELCLTNANPNPNPNANPNPNPNANNDETESPLDIEGIWERFQWTRDPTEMDAAPQTSGWQGPIRLRPY